ncbi:MAG: HD domain-containing protein [Acidobacteria bacterium]|nr:HD domain-containing protein [Acidobacteriota bacterium]
MEEERALILIVDDCAKSRDALDSLLSGEGHGCLSVPSIEGALVELASRPFDIVFSAVRVLGKDVRELLDQVRAFHPGVLLIVTAPPEKVDDAMECVHLGAFDCILSPFDTRRILLSTQHALERKRLETRNQEFQTHMTQMVEERAAETQRLFYGMTQAMIRLLELRLPFESGHAITVADAARRIARELRLTADGIHKIYLAALLHDIGMIPIKDVLVHKDGPLSEEEYLQVQEHTTLAEVVLKPVIEDDDVLGYIRHHHERFDGTGYPAGLRGSDIPLGARIIAVAEAFDAMTRNRPYRLALSAETALVELERNKGTQFDPRVVAAFLEIVGEIEEACANRSQNRK